MASPLQTGKKTVDLGSPGPRVSRIRRDPPPKVKVKEVDLDEVDRQDAIVGVIAFALAIFVIIMAFGAWSGWSPSQHEVHLNLDE